jgi:hypothetical protein
MCSTGWSAHAELISQEVAARVPAAGDDLSLSHFDRTQSGTLAAKRPPSPAQNLADNAREGIDP